MQNKSGGLSPRLAGALRLAGEAAALILFLSAFFLWSFAATETVLLWRLTQ
ncbi:hypothetical protein TRICHSKD4_2259 [Roseibium sp. TrichSKD4]|nr:hypothetical protein TRICHSKD4_2259 [Roseibium sp. TrichSKD4]